MAKILQNNYMAGVLDASYRRRVELNIYQNSARIMNNFLPLPTGGFTLRPGFTFQGDASPGAVRIIPFVRSVHERYIVEFCSVLNTDTGQEQPNINVWGWNIVENKFSKLYANLESPFTRKEIKEIQYTQDYKYLFLAHRNHRTKIMEISAVEATIKDFTPERKTSRVDKDENGNEIEFMFDYKGLFTEPGQYPGCVAFCANRLWFASTTNNPYGIWASRPFTYDNFQDYEMYSVLNETVTTERYLEAIEGSGEKIETFPDGSYNKIIIKVSPEGYVVKTTQKYDSEDRPVGGEETETYYYSKPVVEWRTTVTADSALKLEVGSDRNERIEWISVSTNIFIGTASSEWVIPGNIDAINQSIQKIASYGSAENQQAVHSADSIIYVQSGKKCLRGIVASNEGFSFENFSRKCSSIIQKGIKELHWQRVPQQRLFVVLEDGTMAIYCREAETGLDAWCTWSTEGKIESVSIIDSEDGQDVYLLVNRNDRLYMELVDDASILDNGIKYKGEMETNPIEAEVTMGSFKKVYNVYVDSDGKRFKAGIAGAKICEPFKITGNMTKVDTYTITTNDELRIRIESIPGEDLNVLALIAEVSGESIK